MIEFLVIHSSPHLIGLTEQIRFFRDMQSMGVHIIEEFL